MSNKQTTTNIISDSAIDYIVDAYSEKYRDMTPYKGPDITAQEVIAGCHLLIAVGEAMGGGFCFSVVDQGADSIDRERIFAAILAIREFDPIP